ncbi:predicted protein, partial [Nematostella vectensis]
GYGSITPRTPAGQLTTIAYALIGIPLTLLTLRSVGVHINAFHFYLIRSTHKKHCKNEKCTHEEVASIIMSTSGLLLTVIIVAVVMFFSVTSWTFTEALYFVFVSCSTVGFGDYV